MAPICGIGTARGSTSRATEDCRRPSSAIFGPGCTEPAPICAISPTSLMACSATPAPTRGARTPPTRGASPCAPRCAPAIIYRRSTGTVHMRQYMWSYITHALVATSAHDIARDRSSHAAAPAERYVAAGNGRAAAPRRRRASGTRYAATHPNYDATAAGGDVGAPASRCYLCVRGDSGAGRAQDRARGARELRSGRLAATRARI